jgi:hypothetical protein
MSDFERPKFKPVKAVVNYANPEELFYKLSGRDKSHGYLRGPQQDVLREYSEKATAMAPDIAFEEIARNVVESQRLLTPHRLRDRGSFRNRFLRNGIGHRGQQQRDLAMADHLAELPLGDEQP